MRNSKANLHLFLEDWDVRWNTREESRLAQQASIWMSSLRENSFFKEKNPKRFVFSFFLFSLELFNFEIITKLWKNYKNSTAAAASLQSCPTLWPHRRQPTRLPRPWDSPGKNTGVGCHFLLQCMKVKSQSEVAQSCPILSDPMDCSPPGSSVHGIFQARIAQITPKYFSPGFTIYSYFVTFAFSFSL